MTKYIYTKDFERDVNYNYNNNAEAFDDFCELYCYTPSVLIKKFQNPAEFDQILAEFEEYCLQMTDLAYELAEI